MKIPFLNRPETRAGYTDAIVEALLREATGGTTASVSSLGSYGSLLGPLWGRSFASAKVSPSNAVTDALTPRILETIGRRMLLDGQTVFEIRVEDGAVKLVEASTWHIDSSRDEWFYRADFATPERTYTRALTADRVLHPTHRRKLRPALARAVTSTLGNRKAGRRARNEVDSRK